LLTRLSSGRPCHSDSGSDSGSRRVGGEGGDLVGDSVHGMARVVHAVHGMAGGVPTVPVPVRGMAGVVHAMPGGIERTQQQGVLLSLFSLVAAQIRKKGDHSYSKVS
jgi:hypothetical protein